MDCQYKPIKGFQIAFKVFTCIQCTLIRRIENVFKYVGVHVEKITIEDIPPTYNTLFTIFFENVYVM